MDDNSGDCKEQCVSSVNVEHSGDKTENCEVRDDFVSKLEELSRREEENTEDNSKSEEEVIPNRENTLESESKQNAIDVDLTNQNTASDNERIEEKLFEGDFQVLKTTTDDSVSSDSISTVENSTPVIPTDFDDNSAIDQPTNNPESISDFPIEVSESETCVADSSSPENAENKVNFESKESELSEDESFGDFEAHFEPTTKQEQTFQSEDVDDDFGDFENATFASEVTPQGTKNALSDLTGSTAKENLKYSAEEVEDVIKQNFPLEEDVEDVNLEELNLVGNDVVFEKLRDITESNALKFQWGSSASQKLLLKALNIDMRNIVSEFLYLFKLIV